jgi:TonB family protein
MKTAFLFFLLLTMPAFQIQKRTCDHPAPPEGMHYVCSPTDSCDCQLERISSESGSTDGTPAAPDTNPCAAATLKYFVAPAYPSAARAAKKQGTVTARLSVDATGMAQVKIVSGDPQLAESVISALNKWRFVPAQQPRTIHATFTFAIAGDATDAMRTTVAGSSPFNLVISVSPPLR